MSPVSAPRNALLFIAHFKRCANAASYTDTPGSDSTLLTSAEEDKDILVLGRPKVPNIGGGTLHPCVQNVPNNQTKRCRMNNCNNNREVVQNL